MAVRPSEVLCVYLSIPVMSFGRLLLNTLSILAVCFLRVYLAALKVCEHPFSELMNLKFLRTLLEKDFNPIRPGIFKAHESLG